MTLLLFAHVLTCLIISCLFLSDQRAEAIEGKNPATEHRSNLEWTDARHKHTRVALDPQHKFIAPLTSSQEIGWYSQTQVEKTEMKPKNSCAETVRDMTGGMMLTCVMYMCDMCHVLWYVHMHA